MRRYQRGSTPLRVSGRVATAIVPVGPALVYSISIRPVGGVSMGLVACFDSVPAESWPRILEGAVEAGIRIDESGEWEGMPWCGLCRGRASLGIGHDPSKAPGTIYIWCGVRRYWSRPLSTRRLLAEVMSIIEASVRQADSQPGRLTQSPQY